MQIICCLPTKCQKAPTRLGVHARMAQKCVWVSILQTETIRISIGQRTIPQCQVGTKGWSRSSWNAICGLQVVYRLSIRGSSVHQDTLIAAARDCCSINPTSWHRSHTSRKTLSLVTLGAHHNVLPMHMLSMYKEKVKFSKMASFLRVSLQYSDILGFLGIHLAFTVSEHQGVPLVWPYLRFLPKVPLWAQFHRAILGCSKGSISGDTVHANNWSNGSKHTTLPW